MSLPFDMILEGKKIFLRVGATDFRRGIHGMVSLVVGAMNLKMDEQWMFVFCSTSRKQIRIVYCEGAGCWMLARSVRYGRYPKYCPVDHFSQYWVHTLLISLLSPSCLGDEIETETQL